MPDFPGVAHEIPHVNISTVGPNSPYGQACLTTGVASAAAVWPAIDRAIYVPVQIDVPVTVVKMAFQVGIQSGNYDIGIYDEHANRLVSKGSTAVPVAGIAVADITDTILMPGVYFLALCVDNTTATVVRANLSTAPMVQICGVQQQAVGAVTLPNPATFANPAAYVPIIVATAVVTI